MKQIQIHASRKYTVTVSSGLLSTIGQTVQSLTKANTVCLVTDSNLRSIHARKVLESLTEAGFRVCIFTIPAGEANKNADNYIQLLHLLAKENMTRSDCIIALGGGVVGDLAGFAAATFLRGIPYIQLPTSLLAMVDSSVGGKTGIDLPAGKNLVGAVYQPVAVLCDTDTLHTLPIDDFRDGCAEVIKYGVLFDHSLFAHLEEYGMNFDPEWVISRCIEWKKKTVQEDEYDTGCRQLLNLGHTLAHSIEKYSDYTISHGFAVAAGISIISRSAVSLGWCAPDDCDRIIELLTRFSLPTSTNFSSAVLATAASGDKKRSGQHINLIIPATIGCCKQYLLPINQLETIIQKGM